MPIKVDCPRCKKPLSVSSKKAGSYANCPHCNGRLWVPKDAPAGVIHTPAGGPTSAAVPPPPGAPPPQTPPPDPVSPPGTADLAAPGSSPTAPPPGSGSGWQVVQPPPAAASDTATPMPQVPRPGHKVARFISAEAARSTLTVAEDGQLPELHLEEGGKKEKSEATSTTVNPLVLFGAIAVSVVLSIFLVLYNPESEDAAVRQKKNEARAFIEEEKHFGDPDNKRPLEPYQKLLREAKRAHVRGDYQTEEKRYREVLALLRAERGKHEKGLTGSRSRDKKLEEQIIILLRDE